MNPEVSTYYYRFHISCRRIRVSLCNLVGCLSSPLFSSQIWSYLGAKGNVFSSLYITEVEKMKWQVVFGCHDNNLYSVQVKNCLPVLQWKTELSSAIYSTPCGLNGNLLLAASNNGQLCVVAQNGSILFEFHLPSETFSSPATYKDYIFIGCRNDFLYALLCVQPWLFKQSQCDI